ncbi:SDR family oxidoreductase [Streptomyces sp. HUAS TT7]|uniref:SDR family oxidoreductase n=1 Tax=Streptomyces sp. HUAS TT7 TaxID=3447507 RepID=UPI003F65AFD6
MGQFDITHEDSYADLINTAVRTYGRLDGLYNVAAGLSTATMSGDADVTSVPLDLWQRTIDITLTGRRRRTLQLRSGPGDLAPRWLAASCSGCDPVGPFSQEGALPHGRLSLLHPVRGQEENARRTPAHVGPRLAGDLRPHARP